MVGHSEKTFITFFPQYMVPMEISENSKEMYGTIAMKNTSGTAVGFQYKTSNEEDLTVTPVFGVMEPDEVVTATIVKMRVEQNSMDKLQARVVPLDEDYYADQDLQQLLERASQENMQEQKFQLACGSPAKQTPSGVRRSLLGFVRKTSDSGQASETEPVSSRGIFGRRSSSKHSVDESPGKKNSTAVSRVGTSGHTDVVYTRPAGVSDENEPYTQLLEKMRKFYPTGSRFQKTFPSYLGLGRRSPRRRVTETPYTVRATATKMELNEEEFPLAKRLLQKYSRIGTLLRDISLKTDNVQHCHNWTFIMFCMVLVVLGLITLLMLAAPSATRRYKHFRAIIARR